MARRYEDVMHELVDAIVGGDYAEGERLPSLDALRRRFGAGRDVLREALRGLEERGLIAVHPGRGQSVRQREHWDIRSPDVFLSCVARGPEPSLLDDTIEARAAVEREAAEHVCRRAPDGDLGLLAGHVEEMERALDPATERTFGAGDPLVAADAWFHRTLAQLSGNPALANLVAPLHVPLATLRRARAPDRDRTLVLHHRRMLEGLSSREAELAHASIDGYARQLRRWLG